MMIFNYGRKLINSLFLLCMVIFAFNVQAESAFIDKIKSVSIEGVTIIEIKNNDKKMMITGSAKDNKIISKYMRALDSELGSPNLEFIKKEW
jgi:Fimbrial assembly protein (PilN)